jgi:hypothetical protein
MIDTGPVEAENRLQDVPREKWGFLMRERRDFLRRSLSYDCRCLVQFIDDARLMYSELGFASVADMIRNGYELEPGEIVLALEWLRLNPPVEALPLKTAAEFGAKLRPVGANQYSKGVDNTKSDVNTLRPSGNSNAYALRRLRNHAPAIHERVLAGELTPHAGMIEAGFRKKRPSKKPSPLEVALRAYHKLTPAEREEFERTKGT